MRTVVVLVWERNVGYETIKCAFQAPMRDARPDVLEVPLDRLSLRGRQFEAGEDIGLHLPDNGIASLVGLPGLNRGIRVVHAN
jgi:hypothetical protein